MVELAGVCVMRSSCDDMYCVLRERWIGGRCGCGRDVESYGNVGEMHWGQSEL